MQRANPEYPISRRAALLDASAVVATAGLPAVAAAMIVNPDEAGALAGRWRALERQRREAVAELRAARADMPVRNGGEVAVPGLPAGAYYAVRRDRRGFERITTGEEARRSERVRKARAKLQAVEREAAAIRAQILA